MFGGIRGITFSDIDDGGALRVEGHGVGTDGAYVVQHRRRLPVVPAFQPLRYVRQAQRQRHRAVVEGLAPPCARAAPPALRDCLL